MSWGLDVGRGVLAVEDPGKVSVAEGGRVDTELSVPISGGRIEAGAVLTKGFWGTVAGGLALGEDHGLLGPGESFRP